MIKVILTSFRIHKLFRFITFTSTSTYTCEPRDVYIHYPFGKQCTKTNTGENGWHLNALTDCPKILTMFVSHVHLAIHNLTLVFTIS